MELVLVEVDRGLLRILPTGEARGDSLRLDACVEILFVTTSCFSDALPTEVDVSMGVWGLRANMSLMLRRFSTSNSGSKRPDDGSIKRLEYS